MIVNQVYRSKYRRFKGFLCTVPVLCRWMREYPAGADKHRRSADLGS
jgi:hypothetical protein